MPMTRSSLRVVSLALAVVVAVSSLAGCSTTTPEIEAISRAIEVELVKLPDVTEVEVDYEDSLNLPGSVLVIYMTASPNDSDSLAAEAVRLIWQSEIDPLFEIAVDVYDATKTKIFASRNFDVDSLEAELIAKYGPRPHPRAGR